MADRARRPRRGPGHRAATVAGWREPTQSIPLRWGGYHFRYVASLTLLFAGALAVQGTSVYSGYLLPLGAFAHVFGWLILPARGPRRVIAALPSIVAAGSLLLGSAGSILLVIPLVFWLFLRQRPAISFLVLVLPLVSGVVLTQLFPQYGDGGIVVTVSVLVLTGSAWLARLLHRDRDQRLEGEVAAVPQ